jgi:hypothetical protein
MSIAKVGFRVCFLLLLAGVLWPEETAAVKSSMKAVAAYEEGFAYDVMRAPDGSVMLNDFEVIENDGAGAGYSEKGTFYEEIYRGVRAKKVLRLEDPRAQAAHVVLYLEPLKPDLPKQTLPYIIVNGLRIEGHPVPSWQGAWQYIAVPVKVLRRGDNVIVIGVDAPRAEGFRLLIARKDEYEAGGGAFTLQGNTALTSSGQFQASGFLKSDEKKLLKVPGPREGLESLVRGGAIQVIDVGASSFKEDAGGKWQKHRLGTSNDVDGEYVVRLNLKRFKSEGKLLSTPVDLWEGIPGFDRIKPSCRVSELRMQFAGVCPPGTQISWQVRFADTADMMSPLWGEFSDVGRGGQIRIDLGGPGKRYLQWRAVLATANPLVTPLVGGADISRTLAYIPPPRNTFYIWDYENVVQRYSSFRFFYENPMEPKLRILRERLGLDRLLEGATTDFEVINRLRHHVSQLWHHHIPLPGYPEWNALDILDRCRKVGAGGMCIQFSIVFIQSLLSQGYQARHINILAHETVEVYVDELGKWVHVDPESLFDSYEYETTGGMPTNVLEQHRYFLKALDFSARRPIDWQAKMPWTFFSKEIRGIPQPLDFSTSTGWINDPANPDYPPQYRLAGYLRMMPRNDYFSRPYPRPLSQGSIIWPWNGYVSWYDEATPRKLQYALHTDREIDLYPTLNRVQFGAVYGSKEGEIQIRMVTFAPNFDGYQVNIDEGGWKESPDDFVWKLKPSAVNTLEMRVKNRLGPKGKASRLRVVWHYKAPFEKKSW